MYGYYELVVATRQSERAQSAGYQVSPTVSAEITSEPIALEIKEQRRLNNDAKQIARHTGLTVFWNNTKAAFRQLPSSALPTDEELDELRKRSNLHLTREIMRRLRWLFSQRAARSRSLLLWPALNRLGFNVFRLCSGEFEDEVAAMEKRCAACGETKACRRWLAQAWSADAYRKFCPNAQAFDALPRALLAE